MRKEFLTRLLVYVANFAFAIGVLIVSCAWSGIYPFGDRSFLTEDLMFQYVDFFTWFQNVLLGEGSLFYSTSQALGNNTWGLYSYYLGSPLNFLIVFFDIIYTLSPETGVVNRKIRIRGTASVRT